MVLFICICHIASNGIMIEKEVVGAYFKVLSQNLPGELKKTKKNCSLG
jgi:hypothetical protein